MISLKDWQVGIRAYAESKGFTWTKAEIDTMFLRIISEVCEAAEAARDIPITRYIEITFRPVGEKYNESTIKIPENAFYIPFVVPFANDILVKGRIVEDFEPDEHVAEEMADVFIRLADTTKVLGIDLEAEVWKKHKKNLERPPKHGRGRK